MGTGYNNQAPWANNSDWNPFGTSGSWGPRNDAANLSRYGARPVSLTQYRQNPVFRPVDTMSSFQDRVKPSNWLKETDFASTLQQAGGQDKTFIVDDFAAFGLSDGYVRAKAETFGVGRVLRDHALQQTNDAFGDTSTIYGKQGYALSPAASSTRKINN
ncbi:MAG TPA: hypothetical protein DCG46_00005 [Gammaproteobacteria bacterium]|uniref:Uncharacterized protein n=1 Tax=hydrothermal vent metagenome TaxID=652676 RepID=A0A1W1DF22_9ZZZZ|nr:hypothetical protein [Gammaproteobacteria bacterium]HAE69971.1 hypothetical protein [Gammaproteobacteria bacterium]HAG47681.1 hypothetical protein [Gammaproteobacteria bacterium]HAN32976.1 hypothetical protein [Gammaproteobacteria bacterium]HAO44320.1 hypothetical protein [Gammaproteobacteria bacterium]